MPTETESLIVVCVAVTVLSDMEAMLVAGRHLLDLVSHFLRKAYNPFVRT
jgi:hypothetical protein